MATTTTYKLTLPATFTDDTLPRFKVDPILPDNGGALFLLEPAHPANPWASGVPENSSTLPNIASGQVAELLSAAAGTQYPVTFQLGGGINNGTKGVIERTTKGSLHGIVSQSAALSSGDGVAFGINTSIKTYLIANTAHRFYFSVWDCITRPNIDIATAQAVTHGVMGNDIATSHLVASVGRFVYPLAATEKTTAPNALGERLMAIATNANTTASSSTNFAGPVFGAATGTLNASVTSTRNGKWPSLVFRRMYLEDLTVSGRTYSEVYAIDQALHQKDVLAEGGRYYGDTFTDPATIA